MQESDYQNFIYLALLLVLLVSSLLSRRDLDFKKVLKYLAAWAAIGFVVVALYAYRFEFADFKSRIVGELNPTKARISKEGELVINLAQDGHFYLDTKINGAPIRFMIDTGASDITLSLADAKKIGINVKNLNFNKAYQTANGKSWGAFVALEEIEVANVKFINVGASVNNAPMGVSLLGMSFLRQFKKYEFYQDRLILTI